MTIMIESAKKYRGTRGHAEHGVSSFIFREGNRVSKIKHYDRKRHKKWSEAVKKRAGFECQECKKYGRRDENGLPPAAKIAHHIKPLELYPELAYDLSNGEALYVISFFV